MARCLKALAREVEPDILGLQRLGRDMSAEEMAAKACASPIVFTQEVTDEALAPLHPDALRARGAQVVLYPKVTFSGFHPDCTLLVEDGKAVLSPIGRLHSEVALAGFLLGAPAERTVRLYNALIFQRLGYDEAYERGRAKLLAQAGRQGYGLEEAWADWLRGGAFMHTPNHPKLRMMGTLAAMAAAQAGLSPGRPETLDQVKDPLAPLMRWPVYPEIGRRLDISDPVRFCAADRDGGQSYDLAGFVEQSYAIYAGVGRESLARAAGERALEVLSAAV